MSLRVAGAILRPQLTERRSRGVPPSRRRRAARVGIGEVPSCRSWMPSRFEPASRVGAGRAQGAATFRLHLECQVPRREPGPSARAETTSSGSTASSSDGPRPRPPRCPERRSGTEVTKTVQARGQRTPPAAPPIPPGPEPFAVPLCSGKAAEIRNPSPQRPRRPRPISTPSRYTTPSVGIASPPGTPYTAPGSSEAITFCWEGAMPLLDYTDDVTPNGRLTSVVQR